MAENQNVRAPAHKYATLELGFSVRDFLVFFLADLAAKYHMHMRLPLNDQ